MEKILIVAAHPDDEILGCGGTIAKLSIQGHSVWTLILGEGIASRNRNKSNRRLEIKKLKMQARKANKILGVREIFFYDFPDNRFDTVPLLDVVKVIEKIKSDVKPEIIFTHYEKDLNIDHQIAYKAVITATRPMPNETVKQIYSFETASSTEWNYPVVFTPDVFFDISKTIEEKLTALECYKDELRDFPHTRSLEYIKLNARVWGAKAGLKCAEVFKTVRVIK